MTVVLAYQGATAHRQAAEAKLRRAFPGVKFSPKTSLTLEAEMPLEQALQALDKVSWRVTQPAYADICPPAVNLSRLRQKMAAAK